VRRLNSCRHQLMANMHVSSVSSCITEIAQQCRIAGNTVLVTNLIWSMQESFTAASLLGAHVLPSSAQGLGCLVRLLQGSGLLATAPVHWFLTAAAVAPIACRSCLFMDAFIGGLRLEA